MPIPQMPRKAWLEIAVIILALFFVLAFSRHFWLAGDHAVARSPLIIFSACLLLYRAYKRRRRSI